MIPGTNQFGLLALMVEVLAAILLLEMMETWFFTTRINKLFGLQILAGSNLQTEIFY
jgi:hypothetical protein